MFFKISIVSALDCFGDNLFHRASNSIINGSTFFPDQFNAFDVAIFIFFRLLPHVLPGA